MLQNIREYSQGKIAWAIIILVSSTFVLWGVQDYITRGAVSTDRVKINGKDIPTQQIENNYERLRRRQMLQMNSTDGLSAALDALLKKQALNSLIVSDILTQAALKNGYIISLKQSERVVSQIPAFQINGRFSEQRFNQVLTATLFNPVSFVKDLQSELLRNQISLGISESAFALPSEVDQAVNLFYQKRSYEVAILPVKQFIEKVKITDDQIQKYYQENQPEFTVPEQVQLEYIELSLTDVARTLRIPEKEAQQKFVDMNEQLANLTFSNPDSLLPAAKALKVTVKQTGFFSEGNRKQGGITAEPKVVAAAFNPDILIRKNNSDVIPISPTNVVVVRVKGHVAAGVRPLSEVRASIVKNLTEQEAAGMAQQAGEQMIQTFQSGRVSFQNALKGIKPFQQGLVSRRDVGQNPNDQIIHAIAFAAGVPEGKHLAIKGTHLKQGSYSGASVNAGDYAIVHVTQVVPGSMQDLKSNDLTTLRQQLQNTEGVQEHALYVQSLLQDSKIMLNGKEVSWQELVKSSPDQASSLVQ